MLNYGIMTQQNMRYKNGHNKFFPNEDFGRFPITATVKSNLYDKAKITLYQSFLSKTMTTCLFNRRAYQTFLQSLVLI